MIPGLAYKGFCYPPSDIGSVILSFETLEPVKTDVSALAACPESGKLLSPMNITLTYPPDVFNVNQLNPVDVVSSIASGFFIVAVPLAFIWGGRLLINHLTK
jgi:hypothetical protein